MGRMRGEGRMHEISAKERGPARSRGGGKTADHPSRLPVASMRRLLREVKGEDRYASSAVSDAIFAPLAFCNPGDVGGLRRNERASPAGASWQAGG